MTRLQKHILVWAEYTLQTAYTSVSTLRKYHSIYSYQEGKKNLQSTLRNSNLTKPLERNLHINTQTATYSGNSHHTSTSTGLVMLMLDVNHDHLSFLTVKHIIRPGPKQEAALTPVTLFEAWTNNVKKTALFSK